MLSYTPYQERYFAEQITLRRSESTVEGLASTMSGAKVDLTPHQVDAALFALKSPLRNGALLADEVGLGKTIEAGLVLAQYWSERKKRILLIVPASLRMQWRTELKEKFYIDSIIMDSKAFNKQRKEGTPNPFYTDSKCVVICTFEFAAGKKAELQQVPWDLVIIDEAHKLRNVYRPDNKRGNALKGALKDCRKLLLTATPLQNSLMELYGLTSIIDEEIFGSKKTFEAMYIKANNPDIRNWNLRERMKNVCKRTLRKDVAAYINYTERYSILQPYAPTLEEQTLYDEITQYLRKPKLYALPDGQRTLITMVLRKLLASSSFAIYGTLESLIRRLEDSLNGIERELNLDDFDSFSEYENDDEAEPDMATRDLQKDRDAIEAELKSLRSFAALAESIKTNSKGNNLLTALERGFNEIPKLGGQKKAVIFTESRRTQQYVYDLLSQNGYAGKIVVLNGVNDDATSKAIYEAWKERHKSDGMISGSKQADIKAAVVEAFREEASILIGTEAAAEGINLQFCSIVVNYDLPWNPQRIEQRIGRCHRYGQKNDVVVINFLNENNAADKRVYTLLRDKFKLFSGVFGASNEILGSIESGVDFEKRIAAIYQKCKTAEDIQREFDALQEELAELINAKMLETRQSILEHFDEEVIRKIKGVAGEFLDKFSQWMYCFFLSHAGNRVTQLDKGRLRLTNDDGSVFTYNLNWQDAETNDDIFLRKDADFFREWLKDALHEPLPPVKIRFHNAPGKRHIDCLSDYTGLSGILSIDKLIYHGENAQEHLIFTVETEDGTPFDDEDREETINRMLELSGEIVAGVPVETETFTRKRQELMETRRQAIEDENMAFYLAECAKLDAYFEDLKEGLEQEIKDISVTIAEKKREFNAGVAGKSLDEALKMKEEINALIKKRNKMKRETNERQEELDSKNELRQKEVLKRLEGRMETQHIMTIAFEIA